MADLINLRKYRKRKAREDRENLANQNRISFGRSRRERNLEKARSELDSRRLEGKKRQGVRHDQSDNGSNSSNK